MADNLGTRTYDDEQFEFTVVLESDFRIIGGLLNGCLGLSGECGEFCDIVKKAIFHEKFFDEEHAKKELGDVLWYVQKHR